MKFITSVLCLIAASTSARRLNNSTCDEGWVETCPKLQEGGYMCRKEDPFLQSWSYGLNYDLGEGRSMNVWYYNEECGNVPDVTECNGPWFQPCRNFLKAWMIYEDYAKCVMVDEWGRYKFAQIVDDEDTHMYIEDDYEYYCKTQETYESLTQETKESCAAQEGSGYSCECCDLVHAGKPFHRKICRAVN